MTSKVRETPRTRLQPLEAWFSQHLSLWECVIGWSIATVVFFAIVEGLGGLGAIDTYQSVYSTWAIAHGQLACALPSGFRVLPPLYPLLSGGIVALAHIGAN